MKAAVLHAPRKIQIVDTELPRPAKGEVLIQPRRVGICGSDVSFFTGHRSPSAYPIQLGHEVVGYVEAVGEDVTGIMVGQRVVVEPNYPCGRCEYCRVGNGNICPNKKVLGMTVPGCFAEKFVAPVEFVWAVPEKLSDEDAVTIEPLAVSLHALWQSGAKLGDTIAVLGCGATGLLLVHAAVSQGMRVFAYDKFAGKIDMARQLGAETGEISGLADHWRATAVTSVFECAGVSSTVELALSAVRRGGQVILMGLSSEPASFVPLRFVREGVRLSGSIIYDHPGDFARAIDLVARGVLSPSRIVSHTLPFSEIDHALQLASTGETGKVLLNMDI